MKVIGIVPGRRNFLRKVATAAPAAALFAGGAAGVVSVVSSAPSTPYQPSYFTAAEFALLSALVDRLIPADAEGPGALEAGVHEFIDLQMNTPYAHGGLWFMQPPFVPSSPPQFGYQLQMTPRELYRSALAGLADAVQKQTGKAFADLDTSQRDAILTALEAGKMDIGAAPAATFFGQLLQNVHEGYFCDPKHGGNKNMAAWKMINFPGARADYMDWVEQYGKKYPLPPVSIA